MITLYVSQLIKLSYTDVIRYFFYNWTFRILNIKNMLASETYVALRIYTVRSEIWKISNNQSFEEHIDIW